MTKNRTLTTLVNIGPKIANRLNQVGIDSEQALRATGAVEAYRLLKSKYPNETLPLCYYLYSFEGALTDQHWNDIGDNTKHRLKSQVTDS